MRIINKKSCSIITASLILLSACNSAQNNSTTQSPQPDKNSNSPEAYALQSHSESNHIQLTWQNPDDNFDSILFAIKEGHSAATECKSTDQNIGKVSQYKLQGLLANHTYSVRICTLKDSIISAGITIEGITTLDNPDLDNDSILNEVDVDDDNDGLIEIHSLEMLNNMRHNLQGTGYHDGNSNNSAGCPSKGCDGYELALSLDFNRSAFAKPSGDEPAESGWQSIGTYRQPFSARFEGNNLTLSNLYSKRSDDYLGLFGAVRSPQIKNLNILNATLVSTRPNKTSGESAQGLLVARVMEAKRGGKLDSYIRNIRTSGSITATEQERHYSGGLVGVVGGNHYGWQHFDQRLPDNSYPPSILHKVRSVIISHSHSDNTITLPLSARAGGLIGQMDGGMVISSFAKTNILAKGASSLGGLVGSFKAGSQGLPTQIISSYSQGRLKAASATAGGLSSNLMAFNQIISSYSAMSHVEGGSLSAGFIASATSSPYGKGEIFHSLARSANITNTSVRRYGFIAKLNRAPAPTVEHSYYDRNVSGDATVKDFYSKRYAIDSLYGIGFFQSLLKGQLPDDLSTSGIIKPDGYSPRELYSQKPPYTRWTDSDWTPTSNDEKLRVYCDQNANAIIEDDERQLIWQFGNNDQYPAITCTPNGVSGQLR